jgi:hypothetical protein
MIQLDTLNNPGLSKEEMRDAKVRERKRRKAKRARKKIQGTDMVLSKWYKKPDLGEWWKHGYAPECTFGVVMWDGWWK